MMKSVWKKVVNVGLVIGGFVVIFFGASRMSARHDAGQASIGTGIANADAPTCAGSCGDSGGDSSACGDSGGCGDSGDSGDCGK